jgi:hypothetical protein
MADHVTLLSLFCGNQMNSVVVFMFALLVLVQSSVAQEETTDDPVANPGRPTVTTPATITPVGYLQFETGFLGAWHLPEFSSRESLNEVIKFSVSHRFEFLAASEPFVHYRADDQVANGTAEVFFGVQGIVHHGEGARPTIAMSYFRRIYDGVFQNSTSAAHEIRSAVGKRRR